MTENEEPWREIPGWPGHLASPSQQVKRSATYSANGHKLKERLLRPYNYHERPGMAKSSGKYFTLRSTAGQRRNVTLAEIMAVTFVCDEYSPQTHTIYFNDHNPQNCAPNNLHVVTRH